MVVRPRSRSGPEVIPIPSARWSQQARTCPAIDPRGAPAPGAAPPSDGRQPAACTRQDLHNRMSTVSLQNVMSRGEVPLNLYRVSAPGIARVVSNERLTPPGHDDVRHVVLDLDGLDYRYLEGQSLGVLAPGT